MQNNLYVFREHPYLLGVKPDEFESYLPLNKVWISPLSNHSNIWRFEVKNGSIRQGFFIHPGGLLGLQKAQISNYSVLFLKKLSDDIEIGILMNDFLLQIADKKLAPKQLDVNFLKNFPDSLPKPAFHFVQRHQRKNVYVISFDGLIAEYEIKWPDRKELSVEG